MTPAQQTLNELKRQHEILETEFSARLAESWELIREQEKVVFAEMNKTEQKETNQ